MGHKIRLTESKLDNLIRKTVKSRLNEIHWKTSDAAFAKSNYNYDSDEILKDIDEIYHYLKYFIENEDESFNDSEVGFSSWKGGKFPNSQANTMISYLEQIRKFVERKGKQNRNLLDLHNKNFAKQHDGLSRNDFRDKMYNTPEDAFTPSQREYADYKW